MNERIEKLFVQALEEFKAENKYATIVVPDTLQRDFVGKFALLIVRECCQFENSYSGDARLVSRHYVRRIREHFGVEE